MRYEIFHDVLAQPVLAWRTRHRTEREVESQLAEAHRRRSRLQRLLALALLTLGLIAAATVFAFVQRSNAEDKERDARARRLDASAVALPTDPSLACCSRRSRLGCRPGPRPRTRSGSRSSHRTHAASFARAAPSARWSSRPTGGFWDSSAKAAGSEVRDLGSGKDVVANAWGTTAAFRSLRTGRRSSRTGARWRRPRSTPPPARSRASSRSEGDPSGTRRSPETSPSSSVTHAGTSGIVRAAVAFGPSTRSVRPRSSGSRARRLPRRVPLGPHRAHRRDPERARAPPARASGRGTSVAFDGDGETIVTGSRDRIGRVWSGNSGRLRRVLRGHRGEILDVAVDPDGVVAATVSTDGTGRTWDVPSGTVAAVLFGHTNFVDAVDFSPDGRSIATASLDGTARTWAINGRPLAVLAGHSGAVLDARFSPDGATVASGGEDGTVRLWDAETRGELLRGKGGAPDRPGGGRRARTATLRRRSTTGGSGSSAPTARRASSPATSGWSRASPSRPTDVGS